MVTLTSRPYAGAADLRPLIDLLLTCRAAESIDPWPPLYELRHYLQPGGPQLAADTRLWEDRAGQLRACATIWDGEILVFGIHPQAQSDDLAAQVFSWGVARARELGHLRGERPALFVPLRADDASGCALLERQGFTPEEWSILRMRRPLDAPLADAQAPDGFVLRPVAGERELAAALAMHQEVFVKAAVTARDRLALIRAADDITTLDIVAVAPDGAFAAFCLCSAGRAAGRPGRGEGWIDLLGTRPAFRGRGLGRAILLSGLQQLKACGADVALLGTTSWNVAAQWLFASVGFQIMHQVRWYAWQEDAWGEVA